MHLNEIGSGHTALRIGGYRPHSIQSRSHILQFFNSTDALLEPCCQAIYNRCRREASRLLCLQTIGTDFFYAETQTLWSRCENCLNFIFDWAQVLYPCSNIRALCTHRGRDKFPGTRLLVSLIF